MARKRMFTQKITESDAFLDMPCSAQALYFHLCMNADDDGFCNNPRSVMKMTGAHDDDMEILRAKKFVICFEQGVVLIKGWRMHNTIQNDRYKESQYHQLLLGMFYDENGSYTQNEISGKLPCIQDVSIMDPECIQDVSIMDPECIQDGTTDLGLDLDSGVDRGRDSNNYLPTTTGSKEERGTEETSLPSEEPWDPENPYRDTLAMCERIRARREAYLNKE